MQVLFISKVFRGAFFLSPGFLASCAALSLVVVASASFHLGLQRGRVLSSAGQDAGAGALAARYATRERRWQNALTEQRALLTAAREDAQQHLGALAVQLGELQARSLRLDALGARLADAAEIDDLYFGVLDTPGLGGVRPGEWQNAFGVDEFFGSLQVLHDRLADRGDKLTALEDLLFGRAAWQNPLPLGRPVADAWISSPFGQRHDPFTGRLEHHAGVDFSGRLGSPILAVAEGLVTWSGRRHSYGQSVDVYHGNGLSTRYTHNKKNLVGVGERVKKGQTIALMGSTGRSTGTHLHFEVLQDSRQISPAKFLKLR